MKNRIINGNPLEFFNSSNEKKGEIKISGSDIIINPLDSSGTVIFGEEGTINDIEIGASGTPVDFTFLGGGTIAAGGNTLILGNSGDTIDLSNATIGTITASIFKGGVFEGDGSSLTNLPSAFTHVTASGNISASGDITAATASVEYLNVTAGGSNTSVNVDDSVKLRADGVITWGASANYGVLTWDSNIARVYATPTAKNLSLGANGANDHIYISQSGNVGIGTTSPAEKLTVEGNISASGMGTFAQVRIGESTTTNYGLIVDYPDTRLLQLKRGGSTKFQVIADNADGQVDIYDNSGNSDIRFLADGDSYFANNLGIGTTSPGEKLEVVGNISASGTIVGSNLSGTNTGDQDLSSYATLTNLNASSSTLQSNIDAKASITQLNASSSTLQSNIDGKFAIDTSTGENMIGSLDPDSITGTLVGRTGTNNPAGTSQDGAIINLYKSTTEVAQIWVGMFGDRGRMYVRNKDGGNYQNWIKIINKTDLNASSSALQSNIDGKLASSAVSTFGGTLIDDANASTARATLELGSSDDVTFGTIAATSLTVTSITSSIVTSSILQTEGSNIFGDASSDTHTFNGNVTASGNISASGIGYFKNISIDEASPNSKLHVGLANEYSGKALTLENSPSGRFQAFGFDGANSFYTAYAPTFVIGYGESTGAKPTVETIKINQAGTVEFLSHITASGNISSSGRIYGTHFGTGNANRNALDLGTNNTMQFRVNDGSRLTLTQTVFRPSTDEAVALGRTAQKWSELVVNHVTASGNIISSGTGTNTFGGDINLGANHIGRDGDNYIGFETDNLIKFRVAGATQVKLSDGVLSPQTDSDVDLGTNSVRFANIYGDTLYGDGSNLTNIPVGTSFTNISASGYVSASKLAFGGSGDGYYIGKSGGDGEATSDLRIGSTTTGNTIAMELFHGTNPVSLGIDYDGGNALAFVDSVHSSFDSVLQFKTGGSERFRIGALDSDTFQIKPAAAANDVEITDNSGAVILYSDTSTKRIGIGTSTPTKALQVTGAISSSGDIKTEGNLEIGANSTNADRTLVIRNTTKTTTISTTPDGDNAKTIMRGGNYTHALQLKDSYNNVGQNEADLYYARLNGGYTHESKLTLFTSQSVGGSSAGATTTIGTATSSLTGNVGIGTTTPSEKLHVAGNITLGNNKRLTFGDSSGNTGTSITYDSNALFKITQANSGELRLNAGFNDNSSNKITFQTRGSLERMRITNDGNVGIGTTTPTGKLHVSGAVANSDFYVSSSGNVGIGTTDPQYAKLQVNGTTLFQGASQIQGDLSLRGNIKDLNHDGTAFVTTTTRYTGGSELGLDLDFVRSINATNGGNVGIGTTTPAEKLTVEGNISASGDLTADDASLTSLTVASDTDALTILGRAKFSSYVSDYMYLSHFDNGSSTKYAINQNAAGSTSINAASGQNVSLKVNNSTKVILKGTTGKVGIGTTSPSEILTVEGNISASGTTFTQLLELPSGAAGSKGINLGTYTHIYESGGLNFDSGTGTRPIYFRINGTKKLELDIAGNVTASGDIVLQGTAPSIRIQDTRQLNNPDWDSVSLGNIEFYSSDTTSPGARVLSEIEAFSNNSAASGPNSDLIFKTSANTDSSPQTRLTIGHDGTSTFTGAIVGTLGTAAQTNITSLGQLTALNINGNLLFENNKELRWKDSGGSERTILELTNANDLYLGGSYAGSLIFVGGGSYAEVAKFDDSGHFVQASGKNLTTTEITASSDISASGEIFGNSLKSDQYLYLGADASFYHDGANIIRTDDVLHANGDIHVFDRVVNRGQTSNYIEFATNKQTFNVNQPTFTGNITSSGNISSSGNIVANNATFAGTVTANGTTLTGATDISGKASIVQLNASSSTLQSNIDAKQDTISSGNRLNANLIGSDGSIGNTEFGRLNGVDFNIKTEVDGKASIVQLNTSSSALQSNIDGKQASLTFGKSSGNALKSEEALTTNDILLMGSSHVKGRTYEQLKSDISLNNVENTAISTFAGSSNITTVGTIGTGTWQGTAIASAYLDSDTAHLSGTQTFSGAKTFSSNITANGNIVGDNGTNITGINSIEVGDGIANSTDNTTKLTISNNTLEFLIADDTALEIDANNMTVSRNIIANSNISASGNISSSGTILGLTGSFSTLTGDTSQGTSLEVAGPITGSIIKSTNDSGFVGTPLIVHQFMAYLPSFTDGNFYYGHNTYGPYHHVWTNNLSSEPTDMSGLGAARHAHFMHIVPVNMKNISLKGTVQASNTAADTVSVKIYKTTRSNSTTSTNSTLTLLGTATSDNIDNANHCFNMDMSSTSTINAGEALVLLLIPTGTSCAIRANWTLYGYTNGI